MQRSQVLFEARANFCFSAAYSCAPRVVALTNLEFLEIARGQADSRKFLDKHPVAGLVRPSL